RGTAWPTGGSRKLGFGASVSTTPSPLRNGTREPYRARSHGRSKTARRQRARRNARRGCPYIDLTPRRVRRQCLPLLWFPLCRVGHWRRTRVPASSFRGSPSMPSRWSSLVSSRSSDDFVGIVEEPTECDDAECIRTRFGRKVGIPQRIATTAITPTAERHEL